METSDSLDAVPAGGSSAASRLRLPLRLLALATSWCARQRGRHALARLDDRMLRDIGIDRAQLWRETGKWPWQR